MAAPYKDKPLLEMSDREVEARRLAELQRSGRDAIEGAYPEQFLVPAARGLKAALTPRPPTRLEALYNQPMPKEALAAQKQFPPEFFEQARKYAQKEVRDKARMQERIDSYIREKNAPRIKEQAIKRRLEKPRKDTENALADVAVKTEYANIFGPQEEYKRGGAVKAKAFRGDGIVQRGKTKGRMI